MKTTLLLTLGLLSINQRQIAQTCGNPLSQIDLHGNNIKARILNGGDLFTDFNTGQFIPNPTGNASPSTIYTAGIWLGGIDAAGNLKTAISTYRNNTRKDFSSGPLNENGITNDIACSNWDLHFRVTGAEVSAFLATMPNNAADLISQFPAIASWPARGNPYFFSMWGFDLPADNHSLAGFVDTNNDGLYDPLAGDYPAVSLQGLPPFMPAEIIWCVFNDQNGGGQHTTSLSQTIQAEIQLTAWVFNPSDTSVLNNTVFTSHKIINRSSEALDSFYVGLWVDVDLGCPLDDYVGCKPSLHTMFVYNQDSLDGIPGADCYGISTFGDNPPVQTVTFLNSSLNKFFGYRSTVAQQPSPASAEPFSAVEYYRYLKGSWSDGSPLTFGGTGHYGPLLTDHMFPDDPSDPQGWSMCTAHSFGDLRMLGSHKVGQMQPGQVSELTVAWAVHNNTPPPCNLGNALAEVQTLRDYYDSGFTQFTSNNPTLSASSLQVFPNPTSGNFTLRYQNLLPVRFRLFDLSGRVVFEKATNFEEGETNIDVGSLSTGMYALQLVTKQGIIEKKLVVTR